MAERAEDMEVDGIGCTGSSAKSGEGLPYAPEDWPKKGDIWKWKINGRISTSGFRTDRYLYLPNSLQRPRAKHAFASRPAVARYIKKEFPNVNIDDFFASFTWKIPFPHRTNKEGNSSGMHLRNLETSEDLASESAFGHMNCKAGNSNCRRQRKPRSCLPEPMDCDICCSETGFCRDCCCILCSRTVDWEHGAYSFIRCEAKVDNNYICGHVAHVNCALNSCMAGTVGGSIGVDAEYYCRRCDNKTDLISHVVKLLHSCESIDSQDVIVKILNLGLCILRGSQRASAENLLNGIELVLTKLKSADCVEEVRKMVQDLAAVSPGEASHFIPNITIQGSPDVMRNQDTLDLTTGFKTEDEDSCGRVKIPVHITSDRRSASLEIENEIDRVLQSLKRSQEAEYRIAEQKLYAHKDVLVDLYQQFDVEKAELTKLTRTPTDGGDSEALLTNVLDRVDQIKQEVVKLKDMMEIAQGFGRTPKGILKEHFNLPIDN